LNDEVWVEVEGYPNYLVSNCGRVVNITNDTFLKPRPNVRGHLRVALSREGQIKDHYLSQLVAGAFFSEFSSGEQVENVNGDLTNCRVDNLRLKKRSRLAVLGDYREDPKKVYGERVVIVETGQVFRTARDCARHINGNYSAIYKCLRGERNHHMGYTFAYHEEEAA